MLAATVVNCFRHSAICANRNVVFKTMLLPNGDLGSNSVMVSVRRAFATRTSNVRFGERVVKRRSLKEALQAPATDTPFLVGRVFAAGAGALSLGYLCYYGLGMSNQQGTLERSVLWPQYVRDRIHTTYAYFGGSLAITAMSAVAIARSPVIMHYMSRHPLITLFGSLAAMIGTGAVCRSMPYEGGFGTKQLAWMLHCGVLGLVVAPLTLLGGPIMLRAAVYTGGIVGGLSTVAVCAPNDRFMNMGGMLGMGMGVVLVSSIGTWFLPPTTMVGAGLYSIAMYGGLVLFGAFLLHDTQRVIRAAESYPLYGARLYDPINAQLGIYLDTLNIFIRIAMILAGGGGRRK